MAGNIDGLRVALEQKNTIAMSWHILPDSNLVSLIAKQKFGACVLDMQHGLFDEAAVLSGIGAIASSGKPPIVRVPVQRWDMVERALDFGALGIIAPMINTSEDAKRFAQAAKYPPQGSRSYGPTKAADVHGVSANEYAVDANINTKAIAMIETQKAFENLDQILEVDGIDGILLGPGDFSITMRQNPVPDAYGPDTIEEIGIIAEKTLAAGKIPTAFTLSKTDFDHVQAMGFQMISIGMDSSYTMAGVNAIAGDIDV